MPTTNALMLAYRALWTILEASEEFCKLVPVGNRIKYVDGSRAPEKEGALGPADFPIVRIVPESGMTHMRRSSCGSSFLKKFSVQVATGERQIALLMDVEWAVFCAMMAWEDTTETVLWNGEAFIRRVAMTQHDDKLASEHNIAGWSTAWTGEMEMWFQSEALLPA